MILSKVRDPRLVTIRRGGSLTDSDHHLLALWAASCAEHVLDLFEAAQPHDPQPRAAIEHARAWVRGEVGMMQARAAGGHAMGAARDLQGAPRHAAYAAGQAGAVAHVAAHDLGAAAYAIKAVRAAAPRVRARLQGDWNAAGSATSSRPRSVSSSSTTSGCATISVGRCSTADRASGRRAARHPIRTPAQFARPGAIGGLSRGAAASRNRSRWTITRSIWPAATTRAGPSTAVTSKLSRRPATSMGVAVISTLPPTAVARRCSMRMAVPTVV